MLGWISKRLIMEQSDCEVGKLELGARWLADLGCNQRQLYPSSNSVFPFFSTEGGWAVLCCPLCLLTVSKPGCVLSTRRPLGCAG